MKKSVLFATMAFAMVVLSAGADALAKQCRDDSGKFVKCPPAQPAPAQKCRDSKSGKFAKCGAPGSEPVPAKTN